MPKSFKALKASNPHKKRVANTSNDKRLSIRTTIMEHKKCPSCSSSRLEVFENNNQVWTWCSGCNLNKDGRESHIYTNLTGWQDVYYTIIDSM